MKNIFQQYTKSRFILFLFFLSSMVSVKAQDKQERFFQKYKFVNMTEFGALFGRIKYATYYGGWYGSSYPDQFQVKNRINFSLQTFNGVYLDKKTAAGITLGMDSYGETVLMPVALGVRRNLVQKREGGSILLGSLDAGYSTIWLNEDNSGYQTTGGLMISPAIGYKLPMRNGSAWLINLGYRYQRAEYKQERQGDIYWVESNEVRNYKRMLLRVGIEF